MLNLFRMIEEKLHWCLPLIFWVGVLFCLFAVIFVKGCSAEPTYSNEEIADAIFKAEGGYKATYLYGIVSVKYENEEEARHICLNTIKNQRKRHFKHTLCGKSYLACLAARYCPIGAENDPKGLNKNWLKNVLYFLNKEEL